MSEQGNEYPLRPIGNAPHARNVLDNVKLVKLSNGSYRIDIAKDLTDYYREILKDNPNASTQIMNAVNFISSSKTKGVLESNTHFLGSISNEWFFIAL